MDNFDVVDESITSRMKDIGERIHKAINESSQRGKMGFALLVFDFAPHGEVFYMSDARRDDMIRVLEEFIERQKKENVK